MFTTANLNVFILRKSRCGVLEKAKNFCSISNVSILWILDQRTIIPSLSIVMIICAIDVGGILGLTSSSQLCEPGNGIWLVAFLLNRPCCEAVQKMLMKLDARGCSITDVPM